MTDIVERAKAFVALDHGVTKFVDSVPIINELVAALESARTDAFMLRANIAELEAQVELEESGLGQPPGRRIGDGWSGL